MWFKTGNLGDLDDVYVCCTYISPRSSYQYMDDSVSKLELLNTDMLKYHCQGHIIVMGDINSQTGTDSDVIIDTNSS